MKQCPKCFAELTGVLSCNDPRCEKAGVPVATENIVRDGAGNPTCPACGNRLTVTFCESCGFAAPAEDRQAPDFSVSVVGARGSGKSNYLSVLIRQLGADMGKVYGSSLYPASGNSTIAYYEREYYRPLYEYGLCVPPTERKDIQPMVYALVFPERSDAGKNRTLIFYDSHGPDFENEDSMAENNRGLPCTGGILFMLEPSQLPSVRATREAKGAATVRADPCLLLLRIVHMLRDSLGMSSVAKKIDIPIAVCLSKLDTMYYTLDAASFLRDTSRNLRRPMLSGPDISSCDLEAQSLIESMGGGEFLGHVRSQFSNFRFFGVSALGSAPGDRNQVSKVSPHRALDPMLWLLAQNGALRVG